MSNTINMMRQPYNRTLEVVRQNAHNNMRLWTMTNATRNFVVNYFNNSLLF